VKDSFAGKEESYKVEGRGAVEDQARKLDEYYNLVAQSSTFIPNGIFREALVFGPLGSRFCLARYCYTIPPVCKARYPSSSPSHSGSCH